MLVGRYRKQVLAIVNRYEGHIGSTKGDGLLAVFGYPRAHENDVRRAVLAGLEITARWPGSASRPSAGSASKSLSGWGCIAGWCIWTPPRNDVSVGRESRCAGGGSGSAGHGGRLGGSLAADRLMRSSWSPAASSGQGCGRVDRPPPGDRGAGRAGEKSSRSAGGPRPRIWPAGEELAAPRWGR